MSVSVRVPIANRWHTQLEDLQRYRGLVEPQGTVQKPKVSNCTAFTVPVPESTKESSSYWNSEGESHAEKHLERNSDLVKEHS